MPTAALALILVPVLAATATSDVPSWVDTVSRIGVVGILFLALFALHRRWWVPGWVHTDLEARHERLRGRYDDVIAIALQSSRGVERSASILEAALATSRADERTG